MNFQRFRRLLFPTRVTRSLPTVQRRSWTTLATSGRVDYARLKFSSRMFWGRKGGRIAVRDAPRLRYFQTRDNDPLVKKWGHALVQYLLICLPFTWKYGKLAWEISSEKEGMCVKIYDILNEIYAFQRRVSFLAKLYPTNLNLMKCDILCFLNFL